MSDELEAHVLTDKDYQAELGQAMEARGVTLPQLCALIGLDPDCARAGSFPLSQTAPALGRLMVLNRFDHISLPERVRSVTQAFLAERGLDAAALARLAELPPEQLEAFLAAPYPRDAALQDAAGAISPENLFRLAVFVLTFAMG